MTTMAEVAAHAGVSTATVSRVLRGHPHVTEATRKKVLAAVDALNYRPNLLASALMTKKSYTLGLLIPDVSNPFFAEIARAVEDAARAAGYHVIVCNTDDAPEREESAIRFLLQKGIDGFLAAPSGASDANLRRMIASGHPLCLIARDAPHLSVNCIKVDDFQGGYQATRHLLEAGHRRLAMIAEPTLIASTQDRANGFLWALREFGLEGEGQVIEAAGSDIEAGLEAAGSLLARGEPPTGVFCANDMLAVGFLHGLRRAGLRAPKDVSVVGFDGTLLAAAIDPPLTTIVQPVKEMGRKAVETILASIDEASEKTVRVVLPPTLRQGGSTAAPARLVGT